MFVQSNFHQADPEVVAATMTQLSLKAGLKQWGDKASAAAHTKMKQLHLRGTFKPKHLHQLTRLQRSVLLESHMFLKEKRTGEIKGRTVASGNKQRDCISKEDASSLTVATESILCMCIIDAQEGRDVAVINIQNAFIQTCIEDKKDKLFTRLRGDIVDILVSIAPKVCSDHVTKDRRGIKQLVVQCQNAMYDTMVASLLCYRKFVKSLTNVGFKLNPCNPCVANKQVKGSQMTVCFHVDDCKLSHKKRQCVDKMIKYLWKKCESIF